MLCGTLTTRPNSAIAHARQFHIVVKHDFVDLIDEDFDADALERALAQLPALNAV